MAIISDNSKFRQIEALICDFINKESGHFICVSNDRLFNNLLRKTLGTQLSLPSACLTIVTTRNRALKTVKEMSVRKRRLLVLIEYTLDHERLDEEIRRIHRRIKNAKVVVLTTESELPRLALLREEGLAESWLTKPIDVNTLLLKIALNIKPEGKVEELVRQAEECLNNKAYRFALSACRKIFEIQPTSAVATMIMGDAYCGLEQYEEMAEAYEEAGELGEMYFEPLIKLRQHFEAKGDKDRQLEILERLDALSPLNIDRKLTIGEMFVDKGQDAEAKEFFDNAISLSGREGLDDPGQVATRVGDIYSARDRNEAEEYYRKAIDIRGLRASDMPLYNSLGLALRKQGRWKEATEEYRKAIQVVPDSEVLHYNLALAYADGNQMDHALRCVEQALKIAPKLGENEPVVSYNLGLIYAGARIPERAKRYLQRALSLRPGYQAAQELLDQL